MLPWPAGPGPGLGLGPGFGGQAALSAAEADGCRCHGHGAPTGPAGPAGPAGPHGHCQGHCQGLAAGRLIASCCSHLDLFHLRALNQGGKLRLAQGRLQEPDVQWTLVVVRDFGGDRASVRLANVSGRGKAQVGIA